MSSSTSSSRAAAVDGSRDCARAYLAWLGAVTVAAFGAIWLWVATMPLAFLDKEYPFWDAKLQLLHSCDIGAILVVGDSRAATAIIPGLLPSKATNLAIGGAQPVETYFAVKRALACPHPPRRVIISHTVGHFTRPDTFWDRTVRFGFLGYRDLEDIYETSERLRDFSVYGVKSDGLPPLARNWLYAMRFPPLYFASLLKGGLFIRYWDNRASLTRAMQNRGHYFFGTGDGWGSPSAEAGLRDFRPSAVADHYFDATFALLEQHNIPVDFVATPINYATWSEIDPVAREKFAAYLHQYADRYPNLRIVGDVMPYWPDRFFGDSLLHLNPAGADLFSRRLGECLQRSTGFRGCDLDWSGGMQTRRNEP